MRLVCPNCDAVYEVDPAAIPSSGRDVQCSNCGTSWFQPSPVAEAAAAEEAALFDAPPPEPTPPQTDTATRPRGLDESVVAVLREEAEREAAARRSEAAQSIETQTEMGLAPESPPAAVNPAVRRIAMLKGVEPEPRAASRPQTRREMLPAIEEINSTLRATSERRTGEPAGVGASLPDPRRSSTGFRSGFVLMLLAAVIGVAVYVMAPRIGEQIPGLAPGMTGYVTAVDGARLWLDGVMQQAIATLRGLSANSAS